MIGFGIYEKRNCKLICKQNRGRDISAFLVTCREEILNYEYIGFVHDKKTKHESERKDTEEWIKCLWENMIGSTEYIYNILTTFLTSPSLGILVPPPPFSGRFSTLYRNSWSGDFLNVKRMCDDLNLNCELNEDKPVITLGTAFWARVSALKKLLEINWSYEDFDEEPLSNDGTISHAIERVLAYVAQDAGFDTGWIMTDRYAGERFEYMQQVLSEAFACLDRTLGIKYIFELDNYSSQHFELIKFIKRYQKFYIYGAGKNAKRCLTMLSNTQFEPIGFLVTKADENPPYVYGIPVYSLSNVELDQSCGIVISVSKKFQEQVLNNIKKNFPKFENIFLM